MGDRNRSLLATALPTSGAARWGRLSIGAPPPTSCSAVPSSPSLP